MAISKTIISNSPTRTVVKVVGTAAADSTTITLGTDLIFADQVAATPKANITKVWYSVSSSGDVTVTRNSVAALKLFGHDTIHEFGIAENNTHDLTVTFNTSAGGTIIIELAKVEGYTMPSSWTVDGARP